MKHANRHRFCSRHGSAAFGTETGPDGYNAVAIDARCRDGIDIAAPPARRIDGNAP